MASNALTRLQAALVPGSRWVTVENTKIPDNRGQVRTVTKGGKTTIHATLDRPGSHSSSTGHVFNLPTRVGDVEWLDADTARYALRTHAAPHAVVGHVTIQRTSGLFRRGRARLRRSEFTRGLPAYNRGGRLRTRNHSHPAHPYSHPVSRKHRRR
jgi:hypothetical protein